MTEINYPALQLALRNHIIEGVQTLARLANVEHGKPDLEKLFPLALAFGRQVLAEQQELHGQFIGFNLTSAAALDADYYLRQGHDMVAKVISGLLLGVVRYESWLHDRQALTV